VRFDSAVRLVTEQKVVKVEFTFVVDEEDAEATLDSAMDAVDALCGCYKGDGECTLGSGGGRVMTVSQWEAELEEEEEDERPKRRRRKSV
jgi:hypothetical protein